MRGRATTLSTGAHLPLRGLREPLLLTLVSLVGATLFAWPLLGLGLPASTPALAATLTLLVALAGVELGARRLDARRLALLAALAAIDSGLRLAFVTGIAGFSPIFLLILCAGYAFGASYGFLVGAASLLLSAVVTGGVGPWLPYEMIAAGWVGAAAGLGGALRAGRRPGRVDIAVLAAIGAVCGLAYGAVMDIWDWTFFRGSGGLGWLPGLPAGEALHRFGRFYLTTSLAYDSFRSAGNVVLVVLAGPALLAAMSRFRRRFEIEVVATPA